MENDERFQMYARDTISNVPLEEVKYLVNLFMEDASLNMGANYEDRILDRIIYFVVHEFFYLPVSFIASAFRRGSLGQFGAGRLIPRTVHEWLKEVGQEYDRFKVHTEREVAQGAIVEAFDLKQYPVGKAIILKMDWYSVGAINEAEWDLIPLKVLAEMIRDNQHPKPSDFGIKR